MKLNVLKEVPKKSGWLQFKEELEAKWDAFWENPMHQNALEKERIRRTKALIESHMLEGWALDLGCGSGGMSSFLKKKGFEVDAVDISKKALDQCAAIKGINVFHEAAPRTLRDDHFYSMVLALDLIAELPRVQHRLFFSEASRVLKREGIAVISTPIDIDTDRGVEIFLSVMQTEFDLIDVLVSYDALSIRLNKWIKDSERVRAILESAGRFCLGDKALSHVIAVGKKKKIAGDGPKA